MDEATVAKDVSPDVIGLLNREQAAGSLEHDGVLGNIKRRIGCLTESSCRITPRQTQRLLGAWHDQVLGPTLLDSFDRCASIDSSAKSRGALLLR